MMHQKVKIMNQSKKNSAYPLINFLSYGNRRNQEKDNFAEFRKLVLSLTD